MDIIRQFLASVQPQPLNSTDLYVTWKTLKSRRDDGSVDEFPIYLVANKVNQKDPMFQEIKKTGKKYQVFIKD